MSKKASAPMAPSVVITGVSSGIGRATAVHLAQQGFQVFGSVRKAEDAQSLSAELGAPFVPLVFDVTDSWAVNEAALAVAEQLQGRRLAGLVNNAGIAIAGPLSHLPISDLRQQLEVNLIAPMQVTQAFLPLLGTDAERSGAPGRVVMLSSVSGELAIPFLGPYSASKHGLEGLSDALRRELMFYGIDVVLIQPGPVNTPIWDKARRIDATLYKKLAIAPALKRFSDIALSQGKKGLPPLRIAQAIHTALTAKRPRDRYAVVPASLVSWHLPKRLPARALDRIVAASFGLKPPRE